MWKLIKQPQYLSKRSPTPTSRVILKQLLRPTSKTFSTTTTRLSDTMEKISTKTGPPRKFDLPRLSESTLERH